MRPALGWMRCGFSYFCSFHQRLFGWKHHISECSEYSCFPTRVNPTSRSYSSRRRRLGNVIQELKYSKPFWKLPSSAILGITLHSCYIGREKVNQINVSFEKKLALMRFVVACVSFRSQSSEWWSRRVFHNMQVNSRGQMNQRGSNKITLDNILTSFGVKSESFSLWKEVECYVKVHLRYWSVLSQQGAQVYYSHLVTCLVTPAANQPISGRSSTPSGLWTWSTQLSEDQSGVKMGTKGDLSVFECGLLLVSDRRTDCFHMIERQQ